MTVQDLAQHPHDPGTPPPQTRTASPGWRVPAAVVAVVLLAALAWWATRPPAIDDPAVAADQVATAWTELGLGAVAWATPANPDADPDAAGASAGQAGAAEPIPPPPTDAEVAALLGDLGPDTSLDAIPTATVEVASVTPPTDDDPTTATATLDVTWELPLDRHWATTSDVTLVRRPDEVTWAPVWDPAVVHAELVAGDTIEVRRERADRGRILDASGDVLVGPQRVTEVGLHPARVEDLDGVITAIVDVLDEELGVTLDPTELRADVAAADPDHFVPVITLRNEDYQAVEPVVFPLVGTTFRDGERFLGPGGGFARFTLGTVGEVTAEQLEDEPDRWEPGDLAGRSGVQASRDDDLRGTAGWSIVAVRPDSADPVLHEVAPVAGADLGVTLDRRMQRAAENAIADTGHATAMAVVRPSDGHVLALANSPEATFDIARMGQLPPGSVFKVVTTTALAQQLGVTADTPVGCPNTIEAGGRTISNAGSLALGDTVFAQAFANSCNTSFIDLSRDLPPAALQEAAAQLGVGGQWDAGMAAFAGDVPVTDGPRDLALASFGQGRTLVNPLDMATMMASVASGQTVHPTIVTDPAGGDGGGDGGGALDLEEAADAGDAAIDGDTTALPEDVATMLQGLTRLVVTDGSGRAVAAVPGDPVHGKTGTAEFTTADGDLAKHVWFAGFQGDLAFAVVVTETPEGSGGGTAAPLAADFLTRIGD